MLARERLRFTQPFSQVPASTPVIRMRIGDLIRSNFSKLALTRLFGAGDTEDQFNITTDDFTDDEVINAKKKNIANIRSRMMKNPAVTGETTDGYQSGEIAILLPKRTGYPKAENANPLKAAARAKALFGQKPRSKLVITSSTKVNVAPVGSPISAAALLASKGAGAGDAGIEEYGEHQIAFYQVNILDGGEGVPSEMEGDWLVTFDDLVPDPKQIELKADEQTLLPSVPGDIQETLAEADRVLGGDIDAFNPDSNSIVRSFETVEGKGLGGVITGLTFTELASPNIVWETSEFGSRAPKMLTINMTFAVIHDIAPGIDDRGFSRAIQYPVGAAANALIGDNSVVENKDAEVFFNTKHKEAAVALRNPNAKAGTTKGFPGGL